MKRRTIIFIGLVFLLGCGPYIWFKVPQPEGKPNLESFPTELVGEYLAMEDSSIIRIENNKIIREYREDIVMSITEFKKEAGDSISTDTSFTFTDNWKFKIVSKGDSVQIYSSKDEELFKISEDHLLREYKDYYFLNYKDTNDFWKVKILNTYDDTLEFDFILSTDDMKLIKKITKVETVRDTVEDLERYYLKPTKRELKKILKKRTRGEKYLKL